MEKLLINVFGETVEIEKEALKLVLKYIGYGFIGAIALMTSINVVLRLIAYCS